MPLGDQVDHLIDTRPGRELMRPVYDDPAHAIAEGIYRSGGTTAAYLLLTDTGRVIVNTGMGFEAPHHKRVFDAIRPGLTHYIITTQAHVDHVGGVDLFKEDGTTYVAQQNNQTCQADDARIRSLRFRTAGIWFDMLGTDARRIAAENPGVSMRQAEPVPDLTFDQRLALGADGLLLELHAAVGETIDSTIVWLPERRTALVSNLFGPLFPHFPNLNTLRGDRYRFVEPYLESVRKVRALRPEILVTGRYEPIIGDELIDACLARLHDAVDYVHQRALEGFNAGIDVWTLMEEISCRPSSGWGRATARSPGPCAPSGRATSAGSSCSRRPSSTPTVPAWRWPSWWTPPASTPPWTGPRAPWLAAKHPWPSGSERPSSHETPIQPAPVPCWPTPTGTCSNTAGTSASGNTDGCATSSRAGGVTDQWTTTTSASW